MQKDVQVPTDVQAGLAQACWGPASNTYSAPVTHLHVGKHVVRGEQVLAGCFSHAVLALRGNGQQAHEEHVVLQLCLVRSGAGAILDALVTSKYPTRITIVNNSTSQIKTPNQQPTTHTHMRKHKRTP